MIFFFFWGYGWKWPSDGYLCYFTALRGKEMQFNWFELIFLNLWILKYQNFSFRIYWSLIVLFQYWWCSSFSLLQPSRCTSCLGWQYVAFLNIITMLTLQPTLSVTLLICGLTITLWLYWHLSLHHLLHNWSIALPSTIYHYATPLLHFTTIFNCWCVAILPHFSTPLLEEYRFIIFHPLPFSLSKKMVCLFSTILARW